MTFILNELMPVVRRKAVGRQPGHPWGDMTDMEILLSAGLFEKDRVTGNEGFNLAAIMLFGRDEVIQQASPGYITDCILRVKTLTATMTESEWIVILFRLSIGVWHLFASTLLTLSS